MIQKFEIKLKFFMISCDNITKKTKQTNRKA